VLRVFDDCNCDDDSDNSKNYNRDGEAYPSLLAGRPCGIHSLLRVLKTTPKCEYDLVLNAYGNTLTQPPYLFPHSPLSSQ
jgi:hypothetical protein